MTIQQLKLQGLPVLNHEPTEYFAEAHLEDNGVVQLLYDLRKLQILE